MVKPIATHGRVFGGGMVTGLICCFVAVVAALYLETGVSKRLVITGEATIGGKVGSMFSILR